MALQAEIDAVAEAIQAARTSIQKADAKTTRSPLKIIVDLEHTEEQLRTDAEALYASLNIHESFPELQNVNLEFLQTLLMARDLKINIRKRAIGSFFEWAKLDRAVGGKAQPLGTSTPTSMRAP